MRIGLYIERTLEVVAFIGIYVGGPIILAIAALIAFDDLIAHTTKPPAGPFPFTAEDQGGR